jgi:uncharacterized protein (DUF697 family)
MPHSEKIEQLQTSSPQGEPEIDAVASTVADNPAASTPITDDIPDSDDIRINEANTVVRNHVLGSMGIALVPIPVIDLVALTGIQLKMVHSLAKLYRVPFSENLGKSLIVSLVGGIMPTSTALTLASLAKVLPGMGTATGMVSVSILGGATTYAIGSVFIQHFESGGTLLDFDPKKMREYFTTKLQEGKKVAASLRKSEPAASETNDMS